MSPYNLLSFQFHLLVFFGQLQKMLPIDIFLLIMVHFRGPWGDKVVSLGDLLDEWLKN